MVRHIPCGTFVNESERLACARLSAKLQTAPGDWIILSNLNHAQHPSVRSDEIDAVVIGPPGVFVLEVKHWDAEYLRKNPQIAEREADRIDTKAKRVAGKLRTRLDPGFVAARLLLTRGEVRFDAARRPSPHGVGVFGLPECADLVAVGGREQLSPDQIELAARLLEPNVKVALSGELRTFAGLVNLERLSNKIDAFHRIYRGQHPTRRDRVILHLYDLSATQEKQALDLARREFETIQRWQKSPFVPSLLDSFQEAEGYPGELVFYSLVDPAAPTLSERCKDSGWDLRARLAYARAACAALRQFHQPQDPNLTAIVHRRLSPESLHVRHNGAPLFTDFNLTRLQDAETISTAQVDFGDLLPYVAKLVRDAVDGEAAILAYKRVRAYTTHPNLSTIHAFAPAWEPDRFVALMKWVEGQPLHDLTGVLDLYAEDLGEASAEALAQRWLLNLCTALGELHRVGPVHGDVSPKNLIVQGGTLILTDYDTVAQTGEMARGGTFPYTSPAVQARTAIQPADDLYALAASLFHCLTDREPFTYGTERRRDRGLNWDGIEGYATLRPFLDRATHPEPAQRFADALEGCRFLADSPQATREPDSLRCGAPERILRPTDVKNSPRRAPNRSPRGSALPCLSKSQFHARECSFEHD